MRNTFSILFLIATILSLSHIAVGQSGNRFDSEGILNRIEEQVSFTVSPQVPTPGEIVNFRVESFSSNLNKGMITWYVNGVQALQGVGEINFTTTTPAAGQQLLVEAVIRTEEGNTITKEYSITAASVTLVYEANSYTPAFYKGKALFPQQGDAVVIAIPNVIIGGRQIPRDELVYTWSINNRVIQDASGYGRSEFYYNSDILSQSKFISVEVSSQGSNASTEGEIFISPTRPEITLYEKSSAFGIVERNLINLTNTLFSQEIEIEAYPFYMSAQSNTDSNLSYDWSINNNSLPLETNNQKSVLFRNENNTEGQARISVRVTEANHILQSLSASTQLLFKANQTNAGTATGTNEGGEISF